MPESSEHKHIKEVLRKFFSSKFGVAIDEYPHWGFETDVFSVTFSSITIMVETIWTASKENFYRDLTIVVSQDAQVKVVIVNPKILTDPKLVRHFEKVKVSETMKGYSIIGMLAWDFSDEGSFLKKMKNQITQVLGEKGQKIAQQLETMKKDVFNKNVPSASIISKCLELHGKVDLSDKIEWLKGELYGYYGYIKEGEMHSFENLPGKPYYRRVMGTTAFYFGPGNTFEQDFPLVITQPINEIETWINGTKPGGEFVFYIPPPKFIIELAKEHGFTIDPEQKMPIVLPRLKLEGIVSNLRTELHKFLEELTQRISTLD